MHLTGLSLKLDQNQTPDRMSDYDLVVSRMKTMPNVPNSAEGQATYLVRLWDIMHWMYDFPGLTLAQAYELARDEEEWEIRLLASAMQ